MPAPP
jgi:hypothetical protein